MLKTILAGFIIAVLAAFPSAQAGGTDYGPQTSNEGEIKVTVTPRPFSGDAKSWDFEVVMETHSRSLSDDLAKSSVLVADGKQYLPLGWVGAPPGGHHRKGMLRFEPILPRPREVELRIRLVAESAPRSFKWQSQ